MPPNKHTSPIIGVIATGNATTLVKAVQHEAVEIAGAQQLLFHYGGSRELQFACHLISAGGEHVAEELDGIVDPLGEFA